MTTGQERCGALVIGGGPAGLAAAEVLSAAGHDVVLCEAKPSVGRKFLMAGKSGLNLTKAEATDRFTAAYGGAADWLAPMLAACGPQAVSDWAEGLGQPVFTGSTGRVFPVAMKASPLLRAWLARLGQAGVAVRTRWRWTGWDGPAATFETPEGPARLTADATVLALGGASWARLGSDGAWADRLAASGVPLAAFAPSNVGLSVRWSDHMAQHFGAPVKAAALRAGGAVSRGEFTISVRGLEGAGVYALTPPLRAGAALTLDLVPDLTADRAAARLARTGKASVSNRLRKALRLTPAAIALAQEWGRPLPADAQALAAALKALPVRHDGLRPMDEAISTAGGIRRDGLTDDLMLTARPGVFAAGEMLDWEAPTGGYLLTACLATGRHAGRAAADWIGGETVAGDVAPRLA